MARAFNITFKDEAIQTVDLKAGTWTFHALVNADTYTIGLNDTLGVWHNYDLSDQTGIGWYDVEETITTTFDTVQISLLNNVGTAQVMYPMFEKGARRSVKRPHELDIEEAAIIKSASWEINTSSPVIYKDSPDVSTEGVHTPVTVTGRHWVGGVMTEEGFLTVTANGDTEAVIASASPVTIAPANNAAKSYYTIRLYNTSAKNELLDYENIPVVFKGASGVDALRLHIDNPVDALPADADGNVLTFAGTGTNIRVYEGAVELNYDGAGLTNGTFKVVATPTNITPGVMTDGGNFCAVADATAMPIAEVKASISYLVTGKTLLGASFSLVGEQNFNKGKMGQPGADGYTPQKGVDYFDGIDGIDGTSKYLWVRYSQVADGTGFVTDPTGALYIGISVTETAVAPTLKTGYSWSLIKGSDGINGEDGLNGQTSYLHIKYSNDGGSTFTGNTGEDVGAWIGTYVDFTQSDSTNVTAYTWNKVKGETGDAVYVEYSIDGSTLWHTTFATGDIFMRQKTGVSGTWSAAIRIVGEKGTDGKYTSYQFAKNTSLTVAPTTGWQDAPPTIATGEHLWMRKGEVIPPATVPSTWSAAVRISGEKGADGADGADGAGSQEIYILGNTVPATPVGDAPAGWLTYPPTPILSNRYCYVSTRTKPQGGVWSAWSAPTLFKEYVSNKIIMGWWSATISYKMSEAGIPVVKVDDGVGGFDVYELKVATATTGAIPSGSTGLTEWNQVSSVEFIYMQDAYVENLQAQLISTVTVNLKEEGSAIVTAGISGVQGTNMDAPAFWAGGDYNSALNNTAGVVFRHNSTGKVGVLSVDSNGNIKLMDVADPTVIRLMFSKSAIPTAADILSTTQYGQSVTNTSVSRTTSGTTTLLNGISITQNSSKLTFTGVLTVSAELDVMHGYTSGTALIEILLVKSADIVETFLIGSIGGNLDTNYPTLNATYNLNHESINGIGDYTIQIRSTFVNVVSQRGGISGTSTLAWSFVRDIRRFEFGLDGFMAWYTNLHLHLTETGGVDGQAPADKWNVPGVLAKGRVNVDGTRSSTYLWGAKNNAASNATVSSGTYTVPVNMPNGNYSVFITPMDASRSYRLVSTSSTNFVVAFTNLAGSAIATNFEYMIVGNNY